MATDNSARFAQFKLDIRTEAMARVRPAHVLDCFAGLGSMYVDAWAKAERYLGMDLRMWRSDEPHTRLIGNNRDLCSVIDLSPFNVFDVDAYGEPWTVANIIQRRRRFAKGERGAIVLTDGTSRILRYGTWINSLDDLIPTHPELGARDVTEDVHPQALRAILERWNVRPLWWDMGGGLTGATSTIMFYSATVFEGLGDS